MGVVEIRELDKERGINVVGWRCVIIELYDRGDVKNAVSMFREAHECGKAPVWSAYKPNTLELHIHPSAVACCAVRHFLLDNPDDLKTDTPFQIVVGRAQHSHSRCDKTVGDAVRDLLHYEGVDFE